MYSDDEFDYYTLSDSDDSDYLENEFEYYM